MVLNMLPMPTYIVGMGNNNTNTQYNVYSAVIMVKSLLEFELYECFLTADIVDIDTLVQKHTFAFFTHLTRPAHVRY